MSDTDRIIALLTELRDNQQLALQRQEEHLAVAREQVERSRTQIEESLRLQRQAVDRARQIGRIALPAIVFCIGMIAYLVIRYL